MESAFQLIIENWRGLFGVMHKEFSPAAVVDARTFCKKFLNFKNFYALAGDGNKC